MTAASYSVSTQNRFGVLSDVDSEDGAPQAVSNKKVDHTASAAQALTKKATLSTGMQAVRDRAPVSAGTSSPPSGQRGVPQTGRFSKPRTGDGEIRVGENTGDAQVPRTRPYRGVGGAGRGGRGAVRGSGMSRPAREGEEPEGSDHSDDAAPRTRNEFPTTTARNYQRYARRGRGGAPDGAANVRRTFDRHSSTGRGRDTKKGGGGQYNWGSAADDIRAKVSFAEPNSPQSDSAPFQTDGQQAEDSPVADRKNENDTRQRGQQESEEGDEEPQIDLDEYRRALAAQRATLPQRNAEPVPIVDASEIEAEGYSRYEKEGLDVRRAKDSRHLLSVDDEDNQTKPQGYNFFELGNVTNQLFPGINRRTRNFRGGRGGKDIRDSRDRSRPAQKPVALKIKIDLQDDQAFPTLG